MPPPAIRLASTALRRSMQAMTAPSQRLASTSSAFAFSSINASASATARTPFSHAAPAFASAFSTPQPSTAGAHLPSDSAQPRYLGDAGRTSALSAVQSNVPSILSNTFALRASIAMMMSVGNLADDGV
ncbi:hypothetical protein HDU96_005623 [Phlyctochytrium bullatum]|nr:hypothetical protein HDU96_005623 [Phlyctochytrium bullatum]